MRKSKPINRAKILYALLLLLFFVIAIWKRLSITDISILGVIYVGSIIQSYFFNQGYSMQLGAYEIPKESIGLRKFRYYAANFVIAVVLIALVFLW